MKWLKNAIWFLLTGGQLKGLPEGRPYRVVKLDGQWIVEAIPTQMNPDYRVEFEHGQRVEVAQHAGFHAGALGTVEFHAPDDRVWVTRDGATRPVFYYPHELHKTTKEAPAQ